VIRAVFDTNVLVSAFIQPKSPPGRLLARLAEGRSFEMILSAAILEETRRALDYPGVRKRIRASDEELKLRLAMLDILSVPVEVKGQVPGVSRDPDDDQILAAAVEGCADYIVTGDGDLLSLGEHEGIRIVTPRAFLDRLEPERY
jgi:putative PIN family toxin of toxin-antitoxin system